MGGPGMGGPQLLPPGSNMGAAGLHRPPSGPAMPPGGAGCPMPPQGGAGVGGGGLEAQYMQQQSQIFVFTTGLANQAAEAVLAGQCPSIIAFHCAQPGTKRILEKHPLKIQQFSKQNPAAWLNTLAQMKQRGAQGMPGGPMGPAPGGGALKVPQTFGPGFCGPPHACGPTHPGGGGAAWQPQESWGAGPYGPAGMAPQRGQSPAGGRGPALPQQGHHPQHQGCGPPNGGCFPAGGGAYPGMGGPGCGGNPAQMNAGVKVPDENLTPQQRQHREEQLAMIRKMQKLLFPDQQVMGNATGPPGQQQQQSGMPQQPQGGVAPRPRGPDQFGHCGDHQHEGANMPPQMQQPQQQQQQQQQHFGADGQSLGLLQRNVHQKPALMKHEDWITSSASGNQACCCAGPQGAMMGHPPADWQAQQQQQQQQGGMPAQKPYLEDRRRKGAAATTQPQGLFPACGSEFSASGSPSGYITRPGSCPNPNFNNGTTGPAASATGNRPSSCAGFNSPGSFSNPSTPSGFPGAPGASPSGASNFPTAPGASPGMVFSPGAVAQQQQQQQQQAAAGSFGGRPSAQCGGGGGQFPGSAPCSSPALQPFSPSVRGSSGSSPPNYGGSGAGGSGSPGTVPPPARSPASGASPRLQQGPPPPYAARGGPMAPSPHPPTSPSPRLGTASPATDPGARQFSHPAGGGRLANPSPGSVQTTPLSSPKPCRGGPHTPTTPGGGSAVPSPSSAGSSRKRSATPLTQDQPEFGMGTSASTGGGSLGHPGGIKGEPGLMPVPSPQQIQYLGSLESQELTIQKQANLGVPEGSLSAQGGPPHGGNPMGQNPMGPTAVTQGVMPQQQGMLQGLGHPSEIPPLDMGPSLASENSQGSYHSSCSSGMEGVAPRMGPAMSDGTGGPRFATSPPYDTRFPGGAPHEAPGFGYMDPRCRVGVGPEPDPSDPSQQGRFPNAHHQGFPAGGMPPHQGAAFPGASQAGPTTGARDFGEPMMGTAGFPRPGGGYAGDVPHSPHIQSLQKMTPPFDGSGKGDVPADPLNGPHRGSPGCMVPLEQASAQFMGSGGGGPMMSHGRGAATAAAAPYPTMAPARNSPGPRARGRGSANSAAAAAAAAAAASFGGGANVQVKLGAPNTIQYLPARPQNPVAAPPHRAPSLDFLQRFTTPLTNLDTKVPTQNLQYFPPSGPPQRSGPVMMMRGGPSGPGAYAGARGLPPMDAYGGGPNGPQHGGMPVSAMFQGGKGLRPASPGGGAGGDVVSQPLPPTVGQAFSYKQGPFYGPTTADPNYAVQFHNFQQQLYATNTRSQGATTSGPSGATAAAAGFFGPK